MPLMRLPASLSALLCILLGAAFVALAPSGRAQDDKDKTEKPPEKLTADQVGELQKTYEDELKKAKDDGLEKKFAPEAFERAAALAKQGAAALKAGRLVEARDSFRRARWAIPQLPLGLPDNVGRILGDGKLRHGGWVKAVAFDEKGKRLATAGEDGVVKIWDVDTGRMLVHFRRHSGEVTCLSFSHDGKWIASAGVDEEIRIWDSKNGKE